MNFSVRKSFIMTVVPSQFQAFSSIFQTLKIPDLFSLDLVVESKCKFVIICLIICKLSFFPRAFRHITWSSSLEEIRSVVMAMDLFHALKPKWTRNPTHWWIHNNWENYVLKKSMWFGWKLKKTVRILSWDFFLQFPRLRKNLSVKLLFS